MTKKRILIVSENSTLCEEVKSHMESSGIDICCIASPMEALGCFMKQKHCMAIVDSSMMGQDILEFLRTMRSAKNIPILVLIKHLEAEAKIHLFHAGASAYMEEPIDAKECAEQATALIQLYLDSECESKKHFPLTFGTELIINPIYRQVLINNIPIKLTRTEFDLLFCLARYPGQILSRNQLYHQVWDDNFGSTGDNIVRTHIGNLRKKLADAGKNYIQNSRGIGYKFVPPVEK